MPVLGKGVKVSLGLRMYRGTVASATNAMTTASATGTGTGGGPKGGVL